MSTISRKNPTRRPEAGFTLLEVVLSLGLAGLVTFAVYTLWVGSSKKIATMEQELETYTDIESGQRIILRDFKNIDPSYGTLSLKDDNDHTMFEYYPDVPVDTLRKKYGAEPKCPEGNPLCRIYTLKPGRHAEIVLLLHNPKAHEIPSLVYDPTWAYNQTQNANRYQDGTLSALHINKQGATIRIGDLTGAGARGRIMASGAEIFPGYWRKSALLMFDTPTLYRSEGNQYPENEPPRPAFFVGQVAEDTAGAAFNPLDPAQVNVQTFSPPTKEQTNLLDRRHPVDHTRTIASEDNFFRWLPPVGGGQPLIRLRPVQLVKYSVEKMYPEITDSEKNEEKRKKKDLLRIWRHVYTTGWDKTKNRFIVAENVRSVQFFRPSVTEKAILFTIYRTEGN